MLFLVFDVLYHTASELGTRRQYFRTSLPQLDSLHPVRRLRDLTPSHNTQLQGHFVWDSATKPISTELSLLRTHIVFIPSFPSSYSVFLLNSVLRHYCFLSPLRCPVRPRPYREVNLVPVVRKCTGVPEPFLREKSVKRFSLSQHSVVLRYECRRLSCSRVLVPSVVSRWCLVVLPEWRRGLVKYMSTVCLVWC